jgi:hypothetical protein
VATNDRDDWVIEDGVCVPQFFVSGTESGTEGVKVISVPEFSVTKSAVFVSLDTGQAVCRNFADFQSQL